MLMRATFMPPSTSARTRSGEEVAGRSVQTILVRSIRSFRTVRGIWRVSRSRAPLNLTLAERSGKARSSLVDQYSGECVQVTMSKP